MGSGKPVDELPSHDVPRYAFWRDACTVLARNSCDLLRLAGEPATPANVAAVVKSMPRHGSDVFSDSQEALAYRHFSYCMQCLKKAYDRRLGDGDGDTRREEITEYFGMYMPSRSDDARDMLVASVVGILGGCGEGAFFDQGKSGIQPEKGR